MASSADVGPHILDIDQVGGSHLHVGRDADRWVDTVAGRFLIIRETADAPRLLYRIGLTDTLWNELTLFNRYEHGDQQFQVDIQQANLDGQGRPEVLVTYASASYGSGGGARYISHYLLDLTPPRPLLLLQAATSEINETFGAYAAMHGNASEAGEWGRARIVRLRHHELVLGPIKKVGTRDDGEAYSLTKLPAGHYRYQGGRIYYVRLATGNKR